MFLWLEKLAQFLSPAQPKNDWDLDSGVWTSQEGQPGQQAKGPRPHSDGKCPFGFSDEAKPEVAAPVESWPWPKSPESRFEEINIETLEPVAEKPPEEPLTEFAKIRKAFKPATDLVVIPEKSVLELEVDDANWLESIKDKVIVFEGDLLKNTAIVSTGYGYHTYNSYGLSKKV